MFDKKHDLGFSSSSQGDLDHGRPMTYNRVALDEHVKKRRWSCAVSNVLLFCVADCF